MRSADTTSRAWLSIHVLLFLALLAKAAVAAGGEMQLPHTSQLTPDMRRLAASAQDPTLEPWQRDLMLEIAQPSASANADDGNWSEVPPPTARNSPAAIYDPVRDRMVVFGGNDGSQRNDVWQLSLAGSPAWSRLAAVGTPPPARNQHTAIYDPVRDRMVVFGGNDGVRPRNDVWTLSLAGSPTWRMLDPTGTPPAARYQHTAIHDPVRNRMVVFGGNDGSALRNDVWALSLGDTASWRALTTTRTPPAGRNQHTAIYDPVRDRMVVFGGFSGSNRNDVWVLSLRDTLPWSVLAPAGAPPAARVEHTAFYDPARDRMVVFAGSDGIRFRNDAWELSFVDSADWIALVPTGTSPSTRYQHAALHDPLRDRMVVFAGIDSSGLRNDVWGLALTGSPTWSALTSAVRPPSARYFHTAIYDPERDRMIVFGGFDGSASHYRNDVWTLALGGNPAWSALAPAGTPPAPRIWHTAFYDGVRDRMLVFGGFDGTGLRDDVWELSLSGTPAWSELVPTGTPPAARYSSTAVYDPARDRMVVFGGNVGTGLANDVWTLALDGSPDWSQLTPTGSAPVARYQHTAIYDSLRDRMVVFGGYDGNRPLDDVWTLSLAGSPAWSPLAAAGSPPAARFQHTAIHDPERDRMVVFGGNDDTHLLNDVWVLSLAGSPAWSALAPGGIPPSNRSDHPAIYDPVRGRMVVFGGYGDGYRNDVWALVWGTVATVFEESVSPLEFALPRPNPSRDETTLDFTLAAPDRVVLDVFDVRGRRVKRIADESFTAGHHVRTWRGDDDDGHLVRSGLYFIRMQTGGFQATHRAVQIH